MNTTDEPTTTPEVPAARSEVVTENRVILNPASGEVIDLDAADLPALAAQVDRVGEMFGNLGLFRQALVDEAAKRLDRLNARKDVVGDYVIETNAPTTATYTIEAVRNQLRDLIAEGILDESVLDRVIVQDPPKAPPPKLAKVELNKLARHEDRRVAGALARARTVAPQRRTLTVKRKPAAS